MEKSSESNQNSALNEPTIEEEKTQQSNEQDEGQSLADYFKDGKDNSKLNEILDQWVARSDPESRKKIEQIKKMLPLYNKHDFWDSQPVPIVSKEKELQEGEILKGDLSQVRKEPYPLLSGFEWVNINLKDDDQAKEVYQLLKENYVEDKEHTFRFDYPIEFLRWALLVPGYKQEWHVGVRLQKNKKLFAFISGIPVKVSVKGVEMNMAEINYLCVHQKLRSKRLAPVLIKEITRRVNSQNVWQAVYTAGIVIPKPISTANYYHRSLNPKKLVDIGFSSLPPKTPMARYLKMQKLPKLQEVNIIGEVREMQSKDVNKVHQLLTTYLNCNHQLYEGNKFKLKQNFSKKDVSHLLLPSKNVLHSFVIEDQEQKEITDFFSFYSLPSQILKKDSEHTQVNVAYLYYYAITNNSLREVMKYALIKAKELGFDVFNALDIMDNSEFLDELKFGVGDGSLYYYLYNWKLGENLHQEYVGMILV